MNYPYFSIILPTYNRADFLSIAIRSVINQSFQDWELIIIDDGSTDNSREVIFEFKDERIKYFYQSNQERCAARNKGIDLSAGKYICFLDSDDYYLENRLQLLYDKLIELNEPYTFMFTGACMDFEGKITERQDKNINLFSNKYDFFIHSHIHCQQTCISREILLKNKFNTKYKIGEDTELWLRIIAKNDFLFIEEQKTVIIREHQCRTINNSLQNVYLDALKIFRYERNTFKYPFSKSTVRYMYKDCYFGIGKFYFYQGKRLKAIYYIMLSVLSDVRQQQFLYRLNIIINIILNPAKAFSLIETK